jgi:hypothetical protein
MVAESGLLLLYKPYKIEIMKKLVLTSVTVLLIGLSAFAGDNDKCSKKCEKKCETKECSKDGKCTKKCDESTSSCHMTAKCNPETSKECAKKCHMDDAVKEKENVK